MPNLIGFDEEILDEMEKLGVFAGLAFAAAVGQMEARRCLCHVIFDISWQLVRL